MATTKIVKRDINETDCKIYVAYYHNHNNAHFNTGIKIPQKFFQDSATQPVQLGYSGAKAKNKIILAVKAKLDFIVSKQIDSLEVDDIRAAYKGPGPTGKYSMTKHWEDFIKSKEGTVEKQTHQNYERSLEAFKKNAVSKLQPNKFGVIQFNTYQAGLKEKYAPNTAAKMLKHFRAFLDYLEGEGIHCGLNKRKVKYKERPGLKLALTEDQLKVYEESDEKLTPHLIKVRDLILVQCATGLRISDHKRIDKNIQDNKIVIEAKKTQSRMEITITPTVRRILEKYNYHLPVMAEQNYRAGIKDIHKKLYPDQKVQVRDGNQYKDVFVWKEISSHDMVRSFITNSSNKGMAIGAIAKITGKSVATLLKSYLVESQKVADTEMEKVWGSAPLKVAR